MEKVRPWCGQPSDRGRLKNRTEQNRWYETVTQYQRYLKCPCLSVYELFIRLSYLYPVGLCRKLNVFYAVSVLFLYYVICVSDSLWLHSKCSFIHSFKEDARTVTSYFKRLYVAIVFYIVKFILIFRPQISHAAI